MPNMTTANASDTDATNRPADVGVVVVVLFEALLLGAFALHFPVESM